MKKTVYKLLAVVIVAINCAGPLSTFAIADVKKTEGFAETTGSSVSEYGNYISEYETSNKADKTYLAKPENGGNEKIIDGKKAIRVGEGEKCTFNINVEQTGTYSINLLYYLMATNEKEGLISLRINGDLPFEEAGRISLNRIWQDQRNENNEIDRDTMGNDIRPSQVQKPQWIQKSLSDTDGYFSKPYEFYFNAGKNEISITVISGDFAFESLELFNIKKSESYETIKSVYESKGYKKADKFQAIIQAEKPFAKSSSMLYPLYDRSSPATQPNHYSRIRLNTIGGGNWSIAGQWIEWQVNVPQDGIYDMAFKARQNIVEGMNSYRTLYIDGEVPFAEANEISFAYDTGWYTQTLSNEKGNCGVYLTKGMHTLRLAATPGPMGEVVRELEDSILQLNNMYREIVMVVGVEPDIYRTFDIQKEIPNLKAQMTKIADRLSLLTKKVQSLCGSSGSQASIIVQVEQALRKMVKRVNKIPNQLSSLNDHISSLGTLLQTIRSQPLELDYIVVYSNNDLPKTKASFWEKLKFDIKAFFASFVEDYTAIAVSDREDAITVWVSSGRDQSQIVKKMIDDKFTAKSNIAVNLSQVNDSLINAILAGQGPDIALMVDQTTPVNLAMRNALYDLSKFDDCEDVLLRFDNSAIVPFKYQDGVFALPNTQEFDMLFYRKDIFDELNLDVPQTWDEFYHTLAILQKHNLTVGIPETNAINLGISSGINFFNKILLQNGGRYYNDTYTKTLFDSKAAYNAFTEWTELYTEYSLDRDFNFYNRFRSGEMPLGIQPFSVYNQLSQAAPEIRGLWEFAPIPGTKDENGKINRSDSSIVTGCIMLREVSNAENAWKFMKWWTSAETQTQYGNELEATMGVAARYSTANVEAFGLLNWSDEECKVLESQRKNIVGIPEIPGSYFVSRCLTNAFRKVLTDSITPVKSINTYNKDINTEIMRKRKEFGLE